jgi:hypothetical protein
MSGRPQHSECSPAATTATDGDARAAAVVESSQSFHPHLTGTSSGAGLIRFAALVIAVVPIGLFGLASTLEPNSKGLGTHQQLGLPPCSMRVLYGFRCPGCGMTTSWAHFTRGQFQHSARVNSGGFLLAIFSLLVAFLSLRTFWSARIPSLRMQQYVTVTLVVIAIVTLMDWAMRLFG